MKWWNWILLVPAGGIVLYILWRLSQGDTLDDVVTDVKEAITGDSTDPGGGFGSGSTEFTYTGTSAIRSAACRSGLAMGCETSPVDTGDAAPPAAHTPTGTILLPIGRPQTPPPVGQTFGDPRGSLPIVAPLPNTTGRPPPRTGVGTGPISIFGK